jgi:non-specific serine/threonine protein kinase
VALGQSAQESWYVRLRAEQDNMRAAMSWALANDIRLAQRLAGALWLFWRRNGDYTEARLWLDRALAGDGAQLPDPPRGPASGNAIASEGDSVYRRKVLWGDAWISYYQGDYVHSRRLGDELLNLAESGHDRVGIRNGLTVRGIVAMAEQRYFDALAPLEEAVRICRDVCPRWLLATSLLNLGTALMHGSDLVRSRNLLLEALEGYRALGDELFQARATGYLGYVSLRRGHLGAAGRLFAESLSGFRELGERFGIAEELHAIAVLSAAQERDERAAELAGAAQALWESMSAQAFASDRAIGEPYLDAARRRLGRSKWQPAWRRGQEIGVDRAVTKALGRPPTHARRGPR